MNQNIAPGVSNFGFPMSMPQSAPQPFPYSNPFPTMQFQPWPPMTQMQFNQQFADLQQSFDDLTAANAQQLPSSNNSPTSDGDPPPSKEQDPDWKVPFDKVDGRLSLLGNHKYDVTLAEVKRRLAAPEHLNASFVNSIFRKAKGRDQNADLIKKLAEHQLDLHSGARKSVESTVFTAMSEGEAKQIAADFKKLTEEHFYEKDLAFESLARINSPKEHAMKVKRAQCAQTAMQDIFRVFNQVKTPVCDEPTDVKSTLHSATHKAFDDFSKVTHGFGLPALRVSWEAYDRTLGECKKAYTDPTKFCEEMERSPPEGVVEAVKASQTAQKGPPVPNVPQFRPQNPMMMPMPSMNPMASMNLMTSMNPMMSMPFMNPTNAFQPFANNENAPTEMPKTSTQNQTVPSQPMDPPVSRVAFRPMNPNPQMRMPSMNPMPSMNSMSSMNPMMRMPFMNPTNAFQPFANNENAPTEKPRTSTQNQNTPPQPMAPPVSRVAFRPINPNPQMPMNASHLSASNPMRPPYSFPHQFPPQGQCDILPVQPPRARKIAKPRGNPTKNPANKQPGHSPDESTNSST